VGHYEGDTLVVDTVGIKIGRLVLRAGMERPQETPISMLYAMVDWYGTPHTEALHVVERYRMLDPEAAKEGFERDAKEHNVGPRTANRNGKYLQLELAVEDEGVFTTPWKATMTYTAIPFDWTESVCAEKYQVVPGTGCRRAAGGQTGFLTGDKPTERSGVRNGPQGR
jgi:hypothetical protein